MTAIRTSADCLGARETQPLLVQLQDLRKERSMGGASFELIVPELFLERGVMVALVGASGCGKSTLLDCLALVSRPTSCRTFSFQTERGGDPAAVDVNGLWLGGREAALARLRREHLGYVLQSGGLLPFLTVRENLELPLRLLGIKPERQRIEDLAQALGIAGHLEKKPQFLSGGQRQRAAVLRALVHEPTLVLADEPTAAVERTRALAIVEDLRRLARSSGATVVMVTHDTALIEGLADRVFGFELQEMDSERTRSVCREIAP